SKYTISCPRRAAISRLSSCHVIHAWRPSIGSTSWRRLLRRNRVFEVRWFRRPGTT
ncbi:unnamed protein product, partial [Musa banksii]